MPLDTCVPTERATEAVLEISALWDCSANAYGAYCAALMGARSPYDLINANAVLAADLFEIGGLASAAMLRRGGLSASLSGGRQP